MKEDTMDKPCTIGSTKTDLDESSSRLSRLFTTVKEQFHPVQAVVTGSIPEWLTGDLVRTGPGIFEVNGHKYNHLFDGMAILHKFSIRNGEVTYQSKFLRSDTFIENMTKQRIAVAEFGTVASPDPCDSLFKRFFARFDMKPAKTDNCCVNVLPFRNDEYYVATETPCLRKFDVSSLKTQEKVDISKIVAVNLATAHPHFDVDGTMYNIGSSFQGRPKFCVIKCPPSDKKQQDGPPCAFDNASVLATIQGQFKACPCYHHSFAMTENYIVFMEQPYYLNVLKIFLCKLQGKALDKSFEFSDKHKTKIHIIHKATGEVVEQKFTSPPQIVFHHINAYEDGGNIVMDVIDMVDGDVGRAGSLEALKENEANDLNGEPKRFVFPLTIPEGSNVNENLVTLDTSATAVLQKDGSVHCTSEQICKPSVDLPTINYNKYNGRKYRYFYATGVGQGAFENTVVKCDIKDKEIKTWKVSDTAFISEPIFVPSPGATEEDDGVVLCGVSDVSPTNPDFMVVLDGKTFKEIARASVTDNVRVPAGFHGQFI